MRQREAKAVINHREDELVALKDVPRLLQRKTRQRCCYETVRQWMTEGRRGVVLASVFVGAGRFTTERAINEFIDAYTKARNPVPATMPVDDRASETAIGQLTEMFAQPR